MRAVFGFCYVAAACASNSPPLTGDSATPGDPSLGTVTTDGACHVSIPADAVVHNRETVIEDDDAVGWVCRNRTVTVTGLRARMYVAGNGELVQTGGEGLIFALAGADLALFGDHNVVYADGGTDVLDEGEANQVVACTSLTFDLVSAPDPGC